MIAIICLIVLNSVHAYYKYLVEVYDATFMLHTNFQEESKEENIESDELTLLDDDNGLQDIGSIFEIKNIIFNIRFKDKKKVGLLKLSIGMELSDEDLLTELKSKQNQLKHLIIITLSYIYYEEINSLQKQKQLKTVIKNKINGILSAGSVKRIFFTDFVYN